MRPERLPAPRSGQPLRLVPSLAAGAALLLAGCEDPNTYVEPPPPKVSVAQPLIEEVTDYLEFTGTLVASEKVEIRARVPGILQEFRFVPGTKVSAGDVLFIIDPAEYEANLQAAKAEVAAAAAEAKRAEIELARSQRLLKQSAGSEADVVRWQGKRGVALASIQRAEAQVARAELELSYTEVRAPVAGRVGRNLVDIGNLVGEGAATVLTDVTVFDPIHVYFNLNERDLLRVIDLYRAQVKKQGLDPEKDPDTRAGIGLEIGLSNEKGYPHRGLFDFSESGVDSETGTMRLRGVFENGEIPVRLVPGLFTRVRMAIARRPDMPLVSERAVGFDQTGTYVLVVDGENVIDKRAVELGRLVDGLRVIEDGLEPGERVVVKGLQRARPGAKVDAEVIDMASLRIQEAPPVKPMSGSAPGDDPEAGSAGGDAAAGNAGGAKE